MARRLTKIIIKEIIMNDVPMLPLSPDQVKYRNINRVSTELWFLTVLCFGVIFSHIYFRLESVGVFIPE